MESKSFFFVAHMILTQCPISRDPFHTRNIIRNLRGPHPTPPNAMFPPKEIAGIVQGEVNRRLIP